jgi:hypothetical protein
LKKQALTAAYARGSKTKMLEKKGPDDGLRELEHADIAADALAHVLHSQLHSQLYS